ncbi:uncharacterized protein JCM6883_005906 [Sporobolomyces salmoneus]|uniref:uncharacterized protein n=1 Tax=Sporobolomyces salmoneus TaxID=183962 RepID=UPI00317BBD94
MDQANGYSIANFQGRLNEQTPSSSSPSLSVPFPSPDPLLKSLPTTIALLTVAQSLRSAALSILPSLSKPPQSLNSQVRCAKTWSDYYRLTTTSIIVLRSAVTSASSGESRGGRIELRANAMLAQHLADLYEGTADAEAVVGEGEAALTKARSNLYSSVLSRRLPIRAHLLRSERVLSSLFSFPSHYLRMHRNSPFHDNPPRRSSDSSSSRSPHIVKTLPLVHQRVLTNLDKIVELLGNTEFAEDWAKDVLEAFEETWDEESEEGSEIALARLVAMRERIWTEKEKGRNVGSVDFFFSGGIIEPFEELAQDIPLGTRRSSWFHVNAVRYLVLLASHIEPEWHWSSNDHRQHVLEAIKTVQQFAKGNHVELPALRALEREVSFGQSSIPGYENSEEELRRIATILAVVQACLKLLKGHVSPSYWFLWVPDVEMIRQALQHWTNLQNKSSSILGADNIYRLELKADMGFISAEIESRLKRIVEKLGNSEPAVHWAQDIVTRLRVLPMEIDKNRLKRVAEQIEGILQHIGLWNPVATKTWDFFFTGYIVDDFYGGDTTRKRYRKHCLEVLKKIENLAGKTRNVVAATQNLRSMFGEEGRWKPGSSDAKLLDEVHKVEKVLTIVRNTLGLVKRNSNGNIPIEAWHLWIVS